MNDAAAGELMAACAAGDRRAWEPLFDALAPRLLGFFLRTLHDPSQAEAHVEAAFLELHRRRRTYRRGMSVRRWAFAIAVRAQVDGQDGLERATRGRAGPVAPAAAPGETRRDGEVRQALDGLTPPERMAIHLHRLERMSFEEIAEVLGWTEDAVRCQVQHAYRALRERLWSLSEGEGP